MLYRLDRYGTGIYGTFGLLSSEKDDVFWDTIEPPFGIKYPAIPEGTYNLAWWNSPKFGPSWLFLGTTPRELVLIHEGNVWRRANGHIETEGCVLLGNGTGRVYGAPGILNSRVALNKFHLHNEKFRKEGIQIKIKNCFGVGKNFHASV